MTNEKRSTVSIMTNVERAKILINDAREYKAEAENAFKENKWNRSIRRAQETVELYLKGIMKLINIEFPKVHDIGKFLVKELEKKGKKLPEEVANRIIEISSMLAEKRAPAFYREEEYSREDAREAIEGMRFVSQIAEKLLTELSHEQ